MKDKRIQNVITIVTNMWSIFRVASCCYALLIPVEIFMISNAFGRNALDLRIESHAGVLSVEIAN